MAEMRSFIGKHGLKLLLTISVTFLLVFMILPILDMFTKSVVDDNGFTWSYFKEFLCKDTVKYDSFEPDHWAGYHRSWLPGGISYESCRTGIAVYYHGMCTDSILDEPACTNLFLDRDTAESGSG